MSCNLRIALGTVQDDVDLQPFCWALLASLKSRGLGAQLFRSRACLDNADAALRLANRSTRYLDSWLMSPEICREAFFYGSRDADCSIVQGRFLLPGSDHCTSGGSLEALCHWLDLARFVVVDVSRLGTCRLPLRPHNLAGIFLDNVASSSQAGHWQTTFECIWGAPVLGVLHRLPELRSQIRRRQEAGYVSERLVHCFRRNLHDSLNLERFLRIAYQLETSTRGSSCNVFRASDMLHGMRIAIAMDEVFNRYFPETLDLLQLHGAQLCRFSPLNDEMLPANVDLVHVGCGRPEKYLTRLRRNKSILRALRIHAHSGGRVYAEGAGLAPIVKTLQLRKRQVSMAGILPAIVCHETGSQKSCPVELALNADSWLGRSTTRIRGYRSAAWSLSTIGGPRTSAGRTDFITSRNVVGSLVPLNLASQPELLGNFNKPMRRLSPILN